MFSCLVAGDAHINRVLRKERDARFLHIVEQARSADFAFLNFEGTLHDFGPDCYPAATSGGTYLSSPPRIAAELAWMGFHLVSTANNHILDYGYGGLLRTEHALRSAGVCYAGTGASLTEARAPVYFDCAEGRVGVVAAASTLPSSAVAGICRPDVRGRPGVNPLRFHKWYGLPEEGVQRLKWVAERLGYHNIVQSDDPKEFHFMGRRYVVDSIEGRHTIVDPHDAIGNLESIDTARRMADWVMFSLHSHEGSRRGLQHPADYTTAFARRAIDAGAHLVICHGHHGVRGIELYKGAPIFYGLGSFAFDHELVTRQPADFYTQYGIDPLRATPADAYDARRDYRNRPGEDGVVTSVDAESWLAAYAELSFDRNGVRSCRIHPLDLSFARRRSRRGIPLRADDGLARTTIDRIRDLSRDYGTEIADDGSLRLDNVSNES